MISETQVALLDWVSNAHAQRLARGKNFGRRDGVKTEALETVADLLAEWTSRRKRMTFGDELDAWLSSEMDADERGALIAWLGPQRLPIDQIETILAGAVDLAALTTAIGAVLTYVFLETGEMPVTEHAVAAALIAVGAEGIDDAMWSVVAAWADFRAGVFLTVAKRVAAKTGAQK